MSVDAFVCCCSRIINLDRGLVDTFFGVEVVCCALVVWVFYVRIETSWSEHFHWLGNLMIVLYFSDQQQDSSYGKTKNSGSSNGSGGYHPYSR